jgi:hypothetical protein
MVPGALFSSAQDDTTLAPRLFGAPASHIYGCRAVQQLRNGSKPILLDQR